MLCDHLSSLHTCQHSGILRTLPWSAVAIHGWAIGGSFQRALLCDIRIASSDARFMLPEVTHGVIPDTGGVAALYEIAGHGLVSDMVLTGRRLNAQEALGHGIVSRVTEPDELLSTARAMAERFGCADAQDIPPGVISQQICYAFRYEILEKPRYETRSLHRRHARLSSVAI